MKYRDGRRRMLVDRYWYLYLFHDICYFRPVLFLCVVSPTPKISFKPKSSKFPNVQYSASKATQSPRILMQPAASRHTIQKFIPNNKISFPSANAEGSFRSAASVVKRLTARRGGQVREKPGAEGRSSPKRDSEPTLKITGDA